MNAIKAMYYRFRNRIITAVSVGLIVLAIINIYHVVEVRVTSNDECFWIPKKINPDSTAIFFERVKVEGVTWNAGIRDGDQLLEIDKQVLVSTFQAQAILNGFDSGEYAEYKYMRDGEIFVAQVYIKKLIMYDNLANTLNGLFWMLIGFIVLTAKPDGRIQKLFYLIGVLSVLSTMYVLIPILGDFHKMYREFGFFSILVGIFWTVAMCFGPFVEIYFFMNFPNQLKIAQKKIIKRLVVIIPAILTAGLLTVLALAVLNVIDPMMFWLAARPFNFLYLASAVASLVIIIIQYRKLETKEQKKPIFLIIVALTFGIAVFIYTAGIAPMLADTIFNSPEYFAPIVLVTLVPLVFAYSIFKYQLMDVSVVVKNTIVYGLATITVAAIYFIVIYVAGQSISSFFGVENQGIIAGIFFIIFALVFQSTKDKFQDFLTRSFYPEQFAYQNVLIDLSNELSIVAGLDKILQLMKKTFVDALKIKTFGILIRDKEGNLTLVDSVGMKNEKCVITESRISHFLKEKTLVIKYPAIEQADFKEVFGDEKAERLLAENIYTIIPMIAKSKVVGLLLFGLKHSGSHFAGKDLELLWAAANQAAISIENARLYNSEVEKHKIERDLELARKIQQGLLPQCIPDVIGLDICGEMIPAMQVGGDYYDLIPVSESKLFVIVGDVSGKGLSASLYMTKLQTMIKLSCLDNKSPKEILVEINKKIYSELDRSWFVTVTLALFDTEKNNVTFCRAGHLPILSASNGTVESYRTNGLGVGLEKGIIFEKSLVEEVVNLKPGQTYAFFTDGVTEAMNESNECFGEENLQSILKNKSTARSSDIVNEIWSAVKSFRGSAEPSDDMTMVVVKVK